MSAGVPKHVTVNLSQLAAFKESEEVSIESLQEKRILNVSGKAAKLPLKVNCTKVLVTLAEYCYGSDKLNLKSVQQACKTS